MTESGHHIHRAALYGRVSTLDQEPENQLADLRRYADARGWVVTEYVDRGVSGAKDRRPALDRLVANARRRRFDVLVCWRLDRLGRNLRHLVTLLDELQALGVALWFALGANRANGHRLTAADKKHAILLALKAWPERSANLVAEQIGCAQQYVSRLKAEQVTTRGNVPDRVTGKDGKSYPANKTNGHRLTKADKKHAILLALKAWPEGCRPPRRLKYRMNDDSDSVSRVDHRAAGAKWVRRRGSRVQICQRIIRPGRTDQMAFPPIPCDSTSRSGWSRRASA